MAAAGGRVEKEQIRKAVEAVMKWERSRKGRDKAELLEHDHLLYLILSFTKHPDKVRTNPYRIPIPHPFFSLDGTHDLCLFVDDRRSPLACHQAKQKLAQHHIPVSKVIGLSKLTSDFVPFEAKRKLSDSYDLFLADRTIVPQLPKLIGKTFYRKKKHPIPVDLVKKDWRKQIEAVCRSTFFYIKGGTCSVLKVGRFSQTNDEIVDNISAAIDGLASVIPKRWKNVRSIHLKTSESVALPLYQALPEAPYRIESLHDKVKKENKQQDPDAKVNISDSQNDSTDTDTPPVVGAKRSRLQDDNRDLNAVKPKSRRTKTMDAELGKVDQTAKQQLRDENVEDEKCRRKKPTDAELRKVYGIAKQQLRDENLEGEKSRRKKATDAELGKVDQTAKQRLRNENVEDEKSRRKKAMDADLGKIDQIAKQQLYDENVEDEKSKRRKSKVFELAKLDALGMQEIYNVHAENKNSRKKTQESDFRRPLNGDAGNKKGQRKKASDFESAEMGAPTMSKTFDFNVDSKDTDSDDLLCAKLIASSGRRSYDSSMDFSSVDSKTRKKEKGSSVSRKDHTKKMMAEL